MGAHYQGNAVVNYTEREIPYTRVIEHKHFEMFGADVDRSPKTIISKEYSMEWKDGSISYIPIDDWCSGFFPGSMWLTYNLTGTPVVNRYIR